MVGRVTKRSADEIIAQDIAPFRDFSWDKSFSYVVDDAKRTVTVRGAGIPARMAKFNGDQGCAILPRGETDIHFKPVAVPRNLPDAATQPWPLGDANAAADQPNAGVEAALDWGFKQTAAQHPRDRRRASRQDRRRALRAGMDQGHAADQLVGGQEHHRGPGRHHRATRPAEGGRCRADQGVAQARKIRAGEIRVRDLLRMSSGLDFANLGLNGPESFTKDNKHMRIYFDGLNVFEHAVNQPQEIAPEHRSGAIATAIP